jgi:flagellar basal body P-ring protein FlgI
MVNSPFSVVDLAWCGPGGQLARSGFTDRGEGHGRPEQGSASERSPDGCARMSESELAAQGAFWTCTLGGGRRGFIHTLSAPLLLFVSLSSGWAETYIRDVTQIRGVDENVLLGHGLVVGLDGTGDRGQAAVDMARYFLKNRSNDVSRDQFKSRSVALVVVTARLPAFKKPGNKIDVTVSSMGDASSLKGGTLLSTPLQSPGKSVEASAPIAFAQGSVLIGSSEGSHPTVGTVPGGATVLREVPQNYINPSLLLVALRARNGRDDMSRALELSRKINTRHGYGEGGAASGPVATLRTAQTIMVGLPEDRQKDPFGFMTDLEETLGEEGAIIGYGRVDFILDAPSFQNANLVAQTVNGQLTAGRGGAVQVGAIEPDFALPLDGSTVELFIPVRYWDRQAAFLAQVEEYKLGLVTEDRVLVDEKRGVIAVTGQVMISEGLVNIRGQVVRVDQTMPLVEFLGSLSGQSPRAAPGGVPPREVRPTLIPTEDLIVVLQKMKQNGMLRAELVID